MDPQRYGYCLYETDGPLLTLTLNRPDVLNAMHPDAHRGARRRRRYAADPALRVCIVTGSGDRAFCVGTDLKALRRAITPSCRPASRESPTASICGSR